jgi:hypothetical protein
MRMRKTPRELHVAPFRHQVRAHMSDVAREEAERRAPAPSRSPLSLGAQRRPASTSPRDGSEASCQKKRELLVRAGSMTSPWSKYIFLFVTRGIRQCKKCFCLVNRLMTTR